MEVKIDDIPHLGIPIGDNIQFDPHIKTLMYTGTPQSEKITPNLLSSTNNSPMSHPITTTPHIRDVDKPKINLFDNVITDIMNVELIPKNTNLEFLLVNSCAINAVKVQTIVEKFIRDKEHLSLFCMTETKVDSHDFEPKGIKMFSKHRNKKEKKRRWLSYWL